MKKNKILKIFFIMLILLAVLPFTYVKAENKNNNPLLSGITIDGKEINPSFDQFITDYVIAVDNSVNKLNIEATTDDPNATYKIIGDVNLKSGLNEFEIKVTAEDGITTNSYFIHVTKGDVNKANANLKTLEIEGVTLNPQFNEKDTSYLAEYEGNIDKLNINAVAESKNSKVEILDNENFSSSIHIVTIKVTAEDGITTKEYKITARKTGENIENLSGLEEHEKEIALQEENKNDNNKKNNNNFVLIAIIIAIIVCAILIILAKKGKRK